MCARFSLVASLNPPNLNLLQLVIPEAVEPRYNVAPTQQVLTVTNHNPAAAEFLRWGLVPSWAKDLSIGTKLINARAETLHEKPSFRTAFRRRRCLIFADGFYEWKTEPGERLKTPMYAQLASGEPFAFAGLWEYWSRGETPVATCTIITTEPNDLIAGIHNRMPVILPPDAFEEWLDPAERSPESLASLLRPYPAEAMRVRPVSRVVSNPRNDVPECVLPA